MQSLALEILVTQLKSAHWALDETMKGVTDEVAHYMPPGKANPIAGTYAHLVFSEDMFVNGLLKKSQPLMETDFKNKTGASEIHPTEWQEAYPKWLKEVRLDMDQFEEYAKAVFAESELYIATLSDEELQQEVDLSSMGMGMKKASEFIATLISGHVYPIVGEISVLKGIQGLKGYPF